MSDLANFFRVLACQRSREPAEADDGGLHRSRGHLMLVMLCDGDHCGRHVRDACAGAGDGQAICCDAVGDL